MDLSVLDELKHKLGFERIRKPALLGVIVILAFVGLIAGNIAFAGVHPSNQFEVRQSAELEEQEGEGPSSTEPGSIFVHVSGAVSKPGLVEVRQGDRVDVAIQAAGGFTPQAAQDSVNLARELEDGEQLRVATIEELAGNASGASPSEASSQVNAATTSPTSNGLININTASRDELESLPGVGEATAAKIVSDRDSNGPFKSKEDLKRVSGIGEKKFDALSDLICV